MDKTQARIALIEECRSRIAAINAVIDEAAKKRKVAEKPYREDYCDRWYDIEEGSAEMELFQKGQWVCDNCERRAKEREAACGPFQMAISKGIVDSDDTRKAFWENPLMKPYLELFSDEPDERLTSNTLRKCLDWSYCNLLFDEVGPGTGVAKAQKSVLRILKLLDDSNL